MLRELITMAIMLAVGTVMGLLLINGAMAQAHNHVKSEIAKEKKEKAVQYGYLLKMERIDHGRAI